MVMNRGLCLTVQTLVGQGLTAKLGHVCSVKVVLTFKSVKWFQMLD